MLKAFLIAGALAAVAASGARAQEQTTIQGKVVGVACYTNEFQQTGGMGDAQTTCSLSALKSGEPAGIVDQKSGKLYIALSPDGTNIADKLLPNVARLVEVTGQVQEKAGINTITVQEIKPMDTPSSPAAMGENQTANQSGMGAGMGGNMSGARIQEEFGERRARREAAVPWASSGATGANDTLYNVTRGAGIHNASPRELPGVPHRGTRYGEVYMGEGETNESSR